MAMLCAGFTGGEAEQLRRALSISGQTEKKEIEVKLRAGMRQTVFRPMRRTRSSICFILRALRLS